MICSSQQLVFQRLLPRMTGNKSVMQSPEKFSHASSGRHPSILAGEKSPAASDGELKPVATATTEAPNPQGGGSDRSNRLDGATINEEMQGPTPAAAHLAVPSLARSTRIQGGELIPLDAGASRLKMDGSVQAGSDIHGPNGSATQAQNRTVGTTVRCLGGSQQLTPEQRALALGEESEHPKASSHFKSARLINSCEEETLRHVISQSDKLTGAAWVKALGCLPSERRQMVGTMLMAFADTPSHPSDAAKGGKSVPLMSKRALFLDSIPRSAATKQMRELQQKRAAIRRSLPKRDWTMICSRKGKSLEVNEGDRAKIANWAQVCPNVVCSPPSMTHFQLLLQLLMIQPEPSERTSSCSRPM